MPSESDHHHADGRHRTGATRTLDRLFKRWETTYPKDARRGFSRDGIINETRFAQEKERVLFMLLEPNTNETGRYSRNWGVDLRTVFAEQRLCKPINKNLALWTRAILDHVRRFHRMSGDEAAEHLHRIALMNLKKVGGGGVADRPLIAMHAWRDMKFIREEVRIIMPTLIVCCSDLSHILFWRIMNNDLFGKPAKDEWSYGGARVIKAYHPSTRPAHDRPAFRALLRALDGKN